MQLYNTALLYYILLYIVLDNTVYICINIVSVFIGCPSKYCVKVPLNLIYIFCNLVVPLGGKHDMLFL